MVTLFDQCDKVISHITYVEDNPLAIFGLELA